MSTARVTAALVLLLGLARGVLAATCAPSDSNDADIRNLSVIPHSFQVFVDEDKHRGIASLGTLKNAGGACFRNILVEADYFDDKGKLVDSVTRRLGPVVVPPKEEVAFRLLGDATRPDKAYATQTLRVVAADADGVPQKNAVVDEDKRPKPKSFGEIVFSFITAFGPVILLIVVWWWATYRSKRYSLVLQVQKQTDILANLGASLERIAAAVENPDRGNTGSRRSPDAP